jgi:hypothetical protein
MATPTTPTDAELDAYILLYLGMVGIDISVLPADDDAALVDRAAVLSACRQRLRQNFEVLDLDLDVQYNLATYYATPQWFWTHPDPNLVCFKKP